MVFASTIVVGTPNNNKDGQIPNDVQRKLGRRYSSFKYISSGGTSAVFKAHDEILDKTVAIKVLKSPEKRDLIRFQKEAKALSLLEHPNLVTIMDFNVTTENHAFLIMEFLEGRDLDTVLDSTGPLEIETALEIARQITSAMIHAHGKNITHRDLKTSNIIVDHIDNPQTTVIDFGLAIKHAQDDTCVIGDGLDTTTEGKIQGSPLYMSPEQAQGKEADERSDIYSLGCIIFKMVTGKTPFAGDDVMEILKQHVNRPAPLLSKVCPDKNIPHELDEAVSKMLAKDPLDRFQSMESVLKILDHDQEDTKFDTDDTSKDSKNILEAGPLALVIGLTIILALAVGLSMDSPEKEKKVRQKQRIEILKERLVISNDLNYRDQDSSRWLQVEHPKEFRLYNSDIPLLAEIIEEKKEAVKACEEAFPKLKELYGENKYYESLVLRNANIDGSNLDLLTNSGIERLDLSQNRLSKKAFEYLSEFPNLQVLVLNETDIEDAALKKLWKIKPLKEILFNHAWKITSEGFKGVEQCKTLKLISCRFGAVVDVDTFKRKGKGKVNKNINDDALRRISKSESVDTLYLDGCAVTDKGFEEFLEQPERKDTPLLDLELNDCPNITGKTIRLLAQKNPQLKKLSVAFVKISKSDFRYLSSFKELGLLNLFGRELSPEEMKLVGQLKNLVFLYLTNVKSDEKAIEYLLHFDRLQTMVIFEPNLSRACCEKLERRYKEKINIFLNEKAKPKGVEMVEELLK